MTIIQRAGYWLAVASILTLIAGRPGHTQAQQAPIPEQESVQPQIEILASGVTTLDLGRTGNNADAGKSDDSQIDISDSALAIGAAQRLYQGGIGSLTVGGLALDQSNTGQGTQLFLNQALADYQAQSFESYIGRTDQPTAQVVTFPTLRGDDLIDFTNLTDPFSNGDNVEEHRYSDVAAVTTNQNLRTFENFHAQHLIDSASTSTGDASLNSYGVTLQYLNLPTLEAIERVVSFGGGFEARSVGNSVGGHSDAAYAGGVINLKPSLTNRIDFRVQDIATFGNSLSAFHDITDGYRADSNSVAAAIRYLHSPFGKPASELALTVGYKNYQRVGNANAIGLALTGARRLGEGFDAVAQYGYQKRSDALAAIYGGSKEESAVQIGFVFDFDATFNRSVGPRRTLLNLQHQYIPD